MDEPEATQATVAVVLAPRAAMDVVNECLRVLNHFGIPFTMSDWSTFDAAFERDAATLRVILFATGIAYTDEHLRLPDSAIVPIFRFVTDAEPPEKLLTETTLMASMGYGIPGAINAGHQAARILALSDATLRHRLETQPYRPS